MVQGRSLRIVLRLIWMLHRAADMPTISNTLNILLPTTLPMAMPLLSCNAETKEMKNSGADVPKATTVRPMTIWGTFKRAAREPAPSVNLSAPHKTAAMPTTERSI